MWDRDLLFEGHRVVPYCVRCGTALSSHEVAQGYEDVEDPSVYVKFPVTAPAGALTRRGHAARLDHHAVDACCPTPRVAVDPELDLRAHDGRLRAGGGARGARCSATTRRSPSASRARTCSAPATSRRSPSSTDGRLRGEGPHRAARRLRHRRRRHRHRPHRDRVRRGRLPARAGAGLNVVNPVKLDGTYDERIGPYAGRWVKDADPDLIEDLRDARAAAALRDLPARLPALLALRHAAALLRQAVVVRRHLEAARPPARRQRDRRLAPGAHQARALRALAGEQRRLGDLARALLGHAAAGVAVHERPRGVHRARSPSWRRSRA